MVVSFHPLFEADQNILCAGRQPGPEDLAAIRNADAVILSQGCGRTLYETARNNCAHVFPNYDVRFSHAGKIGQIRLFRETGTNHPVTEIFPNINAFSEAYKGLPRRPPFVLPTVGKFDWGGEGHTVFLIRSHDDLQQFLKTAQRFESSGLTGFLFQEYIPGVTRSLRVVIVGRQAIAYWRVVNADNGFHTNLSRGAVIDREADPVLQQAGIDAVKRLCQRTGINLAGFDVIFPSRESRPEPFLLEINYYFGRTGLGGSESYYRLLRSEIQAWLEQIDPDATPSSARRQPLP